MIVRTILLALAAIYSIPASAATVIATLPDYNGPPRISGFPYDIGVVGTFAYTLPVGDAVTAAFLEGTYGTSQQSGTTAGFNAIVDGAEIVVCVENAANCYNPSGELFRPFSFALPATSFAALMDGSADLGVIMTSGAVIRFGSPTLRIVTAEAAVPEPSTWMMLVLGFGLLGAALRRRVAKGSNSNAPGAIV